MSAPTARLVNGQGARKCSRAVQYAGSSDRSLWSASASSTTRVPRRRTASSASVRGARTTSIAPGSQHQDLGGDVAGDRRGVPPVGDQAAHRQPCEEVAGRGRRLSNGVTSTSRSIGRRAATCMATPLPRLRPTTSTGASAVPLGAPRRRAPARRRSAPAGSAGRRSRRTRDRRRGSCVCCGKRRSSSGRSQPRPSPLPPK